MIEFLEHEQNEKFRKVYNTDRYWVDTDMGIMIDTMCGNAAYVWGYNNPRLNQALQEQCSSVQFLRGRNSESAELVLEVNHELLARAGMTGIIWAVSGSDCVEAGLELAYQYWQEVDSRKNKTVAFSPGYHGCTYLAKSLYGAKENKDVITLTAPNTVDDEMDVLVQLNALLEQDKSIGTVVFETIPWLNGIKPYSQNWWTMMRKICTDRNVLMFADDVWGGFGKVGTDFSHNTYGVIPDIVSMGKSITGGYIPSGCALSSEKVTDVINNNKWSHGHTWQPQMLGMRLTKEVLSMFDHGHVTRIDKRQRTLFKKLGLEFRGAHGLAKEILFNKTITGKDLDRAGLCNTQYTTDSIFLVTPFCEDAVYWNELEQRLKILLDSNNEDSV